MKTEAIEIRVQPTEKLAFREAAELAGISLSSWMRERLRHVAIRELREASRKIPFLNQEVTNERSNR
jgi:uncharacterized protein (DUF1778 family)